MFGSKIRIAINSIQKYRKPLDAGTSSDSMSLKKTIMQITISIFALAWGTMIIMGVGDSTESVKLAASGWVGTVIGYWLG